MIGLVIVAHAGLAEELLKATETIVGSVPGVVAVGIRPDDEVDAMRDAIAGAIRSVDDGAGVIIMTDMFGGTPSNMSLSFLEDGHVEVLTGVNLPMLIQFAMGRDRSGIAEQAEGLKRCGMESITVAGEFLKL
jgi:PTS system mannose-specific IIA component